LLPVSYLDERAVRPLRVVLHSPFLDNDLRPPARSRKSLHSGIRPAVSIEALAVTVLPRTSWFDVWRSRTHCRQPVPQFFRNELGPVTGMRPEECFWLRWEDLTWVNGRNGVLLITRGKSAAARRVIPMTPRVGRMLGSRWETADKPREG
jgi:hypothetical protein